MDQAETEAQQSGDGTDAIRGRSLIGAALMTVLVAVMWTNGSLRGPIGIAAALLFPTYFVVGAFQSWRDRVPFYDRLLSVPLLLYGLSVFRTEGFSLLGLLFVVLGAVGIGQVLRDWAVDTAGPDSTPE